MADLILSGVVGDEILASDVARFLSEHPDDEVKVFINSPGGYVDEGMEVYNLLRAFKNKVTTVITGIAASMGSIIFLAGDERVAMLGTSFLIHKPWTLTVGDSEDLKKTAEQLDKDQGNAESIYRDRTNLENITEYVNAETVFNVEEMKRWGISNSDADIKLGTGDDMAKIDDLKAELEAEQARNEKLEAENEERKMEAQIAEMKLKNAKLEAGADKVEEETTEDDSTEEPKETEVETVEEPKDKETKNEEPKMKIKVSDTSKVVRGNANSTIPAFVPTGSKY